MVTASCKNNACGAEGHQCVWRVQCCLINVGNGGREACREYRNGIFECAAGEQREECVRGNRIVKKSTRVRRRTGTNGKRSPRVR